MNKATVKVDSFFIKPLDIWATLRGGLLSFSSTRNCRTDTHREMSLSWFHVSSIRQSIEAITLIYPVFLLFCMCLFQTMSFEMLILASSLTLSLCKGKQSSIVYLYIFSFLRFILFDVYDCFAHVYVLNTICMPGGYWDEDVGSP